jgi:hypothetical protein
MTVRGTVSSSNLRTRQLFARLRGVYLTESAEAEVDEKGQFNLAVRFMGTGKRPKSIRRALKNIMYPQLLHFSATHGNTLSGCVIPSVPVDARCE